MLNQDLIYQIGITLVKGIGNITAKQLVENVENVALLFKEKKHVVEKISGLPRRIINEIHNPDVLNRAEKEVRFIEKKRVTPLFITDPDYPNRLKECVDAPVMLYYCGKADLNSEKIISIVGTRNSTVYGKEMTDKLVHDINEKFPETVIVSGLAYGIDIAAHRACLREEMATVGILAHGLDRIYPPAHSNAATEMIKRGGVLTDFICDTNPDRQNFVKRNRIVAGISDCTVVIESAQKGGALITANIADSYNRDIFAYPGKVGDKYSEGCNMLIRSKKAALITSAQDIFHEMNWCDSPEKEQIQNVQRVLFPDLNPEEQRLIDILSKAGSMQLNLIAIELDLPVSKLAVILFELEMKGLVKCKPGGIYCLL